MGCNDQLCMYVVKECRRLLDLLSGDSVSHLSESRAQQYSVKLQSQGGCTTSGILSSRFGDATYLGQAGRHAEILSRRQPILGQ